MNNQLSSFVIAKTPMFENAFKRLKKRFKSIDKDLDSFLLTIKNIDDLGTPLSNNAYKARIKNSDKQKGKSAGYRLITLLKVVDKKIHLIYIFDKSDFENISDDDLLILINEV